MGRGFACSCCGTWHDSVPMSYGADAPIYWDWLSESERRERAELSSDQCIIDNQHFFLRGRIEIPILDAADRFYWGVWVSVSPESFRRSSELWRQAGRENQPPFFGWLSTRLPVYTDTLNLKTMVHTQRIGERPLIEIEPTDHPLAPEQRNGITFKRLQQIAEAMLHPPD